MDNNTIFRQAELEEQCPVVAVGAGDDELSLVRRCILSAWMECPYRLNRLKLKGLIYERLESQGLGKWAGLLMTWNHVTNTSTWESKDTE